MQIMAMRISGMEDVEIAAALKISPKSISAYVWRASRNGWLQLDNPKERIQYEILHQVVDNLQAGLADKGMLANGMPVKTHVAMKIAEGTVFKAFDQAAASVAPSTIVAVRIEMPAGPRQVMRDDTVGGTPAYVDAETVPA
jgi:hypothetical protein